MRFLVISDTHGDIKKALEIYRSCVSDGRKLDGVIHLGDYIDDAENIMEELDVPLYSVKGNCDGDYSGDFKVIDTEAGRILLTHGHGQKVKMTLMNLIYRAHELDCVAALFGHTHMPLVEEEEDLLLVNPGSLTYPGDGSQGSYAILTTTEDGPEASILYYHPAGSNAGGGQGGNGAAPKKKVSGGHLRGILNNCDRL